MVNPPDGAYTVAVNGVSATFAWPSAPSSGSEPGIQAFESQLMQALHSRDYVAMRGLMGDTFMIAGWGSEGSMYAPEAAIEPLRSNSLSLDAALTFDPNRDLSALLDGANPFALITPDVRNPSALFVSDWGPEGQDEAIPYGRSRRRQPLLARRVVCVRRIPPLEQIPNRYTIFAAGIVTPAQAGVQALRLDSRLRGNDGLVNQIGMRC